MTAFSPKQRTVLSWWVPGNPNRDREAIVCDGAVRSGKTLAMGLSFFLWAMSCFSGQKFGVCGKTIASLRRNVLSEILPKLEALGAKWKEKRTDNLLTVKFRGRENQFYVFGGRDESSASLIQGITFAGVLLDEVALMPRSFVEQACARCSVAGSRLWFNCNPAGPGHWFYRTWILEAEKRNCLRLHFTMEDNPSLTPEIRQRYQKLYTGVFYRRFILGQWAQAEGRVYDFFSPEMVGKAPESCEKWYISCDYGTVNPTSMGLWGLRGGVWYRVKEFYFNSREARRQMTDEEYARALEGLAGERRITAVIVDPSAEGVAGAQGGKRCSQRYPADLRSAEGREDRDLRGVRGLSAGDGRVRLGFIRRREGQGAQGARPRHGRHAVLRRHGSGGAAGGSFRVGGGKKALTGDVRVIFA